MELVCSFYIGHQDYLDFNPNLSEEDGHELLASDVYRIMSENIGNDQFTVYPAKDNAVLNAQLTIDGIDIDSSGFNTETALADDQEGLPVLYYVNAYFQVPEELEATISDLDDEGRLDEMAKCYLNCGPHRFTDGGAVQIVE